MTKQMCGVSGLWAEDSVIFCVKFIRYISVNKKLSCCRETARRSISRRKCSYRICSYSSLESAVMGKYKHDFIRIVI